MTVSIDMQWDLASPGSIPIHHQYLLLSAVSRIVPVVHASGEFGIHPIRGMRTTPGRLELLSHSALTIRTTVDNIPALLPLSGKQIKLGGCRLRLGVPRVIGLLACPALTSKLVTIKGYMAEEEFGVAVRRQLNILGVDRSATVEVGERKVVKIKQQIIVGFATRINHLDERDSLMIQTFGIGGRRHIGCGLFNPQHPIEKLGGCE